MATEAINSYQAFKTFTKICKYRMSKRLHMLISKHLYQKQTEI